MSERLGTTSVQRLQSLDVECRGGVRAIPVEELSDGCRIVVGVHSECVSKEVTEVLALNVKDEVTNDAVVITWGDSHVLLQSEHLGLGWLHLDIVHLLLVLHGFQSHQWSGDLLLSGRFGGLLDLHKVREPCTEGSLVLVLVLVVSEPGFLLLRSTERDESLLNVQSRSVEVTVPSVSESKDRDLDSLEEIGCEVRVRDVLPECVGIVGHLAFSSGGAKDNHIVHRLEHFRAHFVELIERDGKLARPAEISHPVGELSGGSSVGSDQDLQRHGVSSSFSQRFVTSLEPLETVDSLVSPGLELLAETGGDLGVSSVQNLESVLQFSEVVHRH